MPAQIPTERPSLQTSLVERYASQACGGAFNAKDVQNQPIDFGLLDKTFETPSDMKGEFNEKALNFVDTTGWNNKKYKP